MHSRFLFTLTLVAVSLLACRRDEPTVEPAPETAATSEPASLQPAVEAPDGCQVMLVLEADKGKLDGPVMLLARAKNLTAKPLELSLADHCPGGEAQFSGLDTQDRSYDYYHTCGMGACMGGRPPKVIALPPGEIVDIDATQIDAEGEMPCNGAIASGTYKLSFSVSPAEGTSNPVMCGPEPLELRRK